MKYIIKIIILLIAIISLVGCQSKKINELKIQELEEEIENKSQDVKKKNEEMNALKDDIAEKDRIISKLKEDIEKLNIKFLNKKQDEMFDGTIVYGRKTIIGHSQKRLQYMIKNILKQNNITYSFDSSNGKTLSYLVENDTRFSNVKKISNTNYSIYSIDKKIGEANGKYAGLEWYDYILFDDKINENFYISGDYDHMPRDVNVIINTVYDIEGNVDIVKYKDYDKTDIINLGKRILGKNKDIVIAQLFECDLDGDGKIEKIVNFNNAIEESKEISQNWFNKTDYDKYYAVVMVLDEKNLNFNFIQSKTSFDIKSSKDFVNEGGYLFTDVKNIIDVNNDNKMEIITKLSIWEGFGYRTSFVLDNFILNEDYFY